MGSVQTKIAVMVEAPVDNWHGNRSQFLPARGWRFSSNTHPYQNVFLVGRNKKIRVFTVELSVMIHVSW